MKPPLFSVLPRPTHPTRDGLAIRNYHLLTALSEVFDVRAFVLRAPHLPAGEYPPGVIVREFPQRSRAVRRLASAAASVFTGGAYSPRLYRSRALAHALRAEAAKLSVPPAWVVAHAYHVGPLALAAGPPAWIDFHNLDSQIWRRMGETASSPAARWFAGRQAPRVRDFERRLLLAARGVSCVSEPDAAEMRRLAPSASPIVVPNGVDLERYRFRETVVPDGGVLFVGDLTWAPNAEGLAWLAERVWPLVRASRPDLKVEVLGRGAAGDLVRRARGFTFLGEGGDTRPLWARAAVAVVPLLAGGGTRLKILEAAAAGAPVVSTSVGAEGLGFEPGTEILLADEPAAFAAAVLRLAGDAPLARRIAVAARARVERDYGWRAIGERFANALASRALADRPAR